jgi:hypothetical protein
MIRPLSLLLPLALLAALVVIPPAPAQTSARQPARFDCPHYPCTDGIEAGLVHDGPVHAGVEVQCDLPNDLLKANISVKGAGCCTFRSTEYCAIYQNVPALYSLPEWLKAHGYAGGGYPSKQAEIMNACAKDRGFPPVQFVQYEGKDPAVLDLALETGRPAAVTFGSAHMTTLVHLDSQWAVIRDNNAIGPNDLYWIPRNEFLNRWWTQGRSGWAVILLAPRPPAPPHNGKPAYGLDGLDLAANADEGPAAGLAGDLRGWRLHGHRRVHSGRDRNGLAAARPAGPLGGDAAVAGRGVAAHYPATSLPLGRCPCPRCLAPYAWRPVPGEPDQMALLHCGTQVGCWSLAGHYYRPLHPHDVWGPACEPPIAPPGVIADQIRTTGERYSLGGEECSKEQAMAALVDDSAALSLTLITADQGTQTRFLADLAGAEFAQLRSGVVTQVYAPDNWALRCGFVTTGTQVYLQKPDGQVVARVPAYAGAETLRKIDPSYDPSKDRDPTKPQTPVQPGPNVIPDAGPGPAGIPSDHLACLGLCVAALAGLGFASKRK